MLQYVALAIFGVVYALIIGRRRFGIPIWAAMLVGAALMVGLQVTSVEAAFKAVNLDVIGFLFGMFSIVSALERGGVLKRLARKMLSVAKTPARLLMIFVVGMGVLAAFLVNDTIALLGIPLVVYVAKRFGMKPNILLIALALGITVGSVMTPIGNPQNLLIAIQSGMPLPFITFLLYLTVPNVANLFVTYFILKWYFRKDLVTATSAGNNDSALILEMTADDDGATATKEADPRLAKLSIAVLAATLVGFVVSEALHLLKLVDLSLSIVAMLGAAALYALSRDRTNIMKSVDYSVLIFFGAMFVVTSSMWSSGGISVITGWLPNPNPNDPLQSMGVITTASLTMSQVLSNVPFVSLYNFVMISNGFTSNHIIQWLMLAASSTIAGNLTILGAASNVIIIEAAEARGVRAFSFLEFFKVGSIVTAANVAVYLVFFILFL
jgi:Na+/H+ antiporter NhaD/arsenite permease-like protein